ncbi:MAG: hypothetical protein FH748_06085, partial [Balneolaceae bacterium]|nr:hypothetical protein [Balneolaceae bacterium]
MDEGSPLYGNQLNVIWSLYADWVVGNKVNPVPDLTDYRSHMLKVSTFISWKKIAYVRYDLYPQHILLESSQPGTSKIGL